MYCISMMSCDAAVRASLFDIVRCLVRESVGQVCASVCVYVCVLVCSPVQIYIINTQMQILLPGLASHPPRTNLLGMGAVDLPPFPSPFPPHTLHTTMHISLLQTPCTYVDKI